MTTDELRAERAALQTEAGELLDRSETVLTDADRERFDAITARIDALDADLERRRGLMERATRGTAAPGDGAAGAGHARAEFHVNRGRNTDLGSDEIYDRSGLNTDHPGHGETFRDRSLAAIEHWDRSIPAEWRESAERLVEDAPRSRNARMLAAHILETSSPAYVRAFDAYLRNPTGFGMAIDPDDARTFAMANQRAINEGSVGAGQAIVPPFLDPTIILTNVGIVNPYRQISTTKTIMTQTWLGVTSAGVTASWSAESAEVTDASPTFTQPSITPIRGSAYIQSSFEALEDTSLGTDIAMLFADARDRLEGAAFATGTGSTQPRGVVTVLAATTASRVSANTNGSIGYVDILALDGALPPRYRNGNTSWTAAKGILNIVRQAALPTSVNFSPWVDFGGALPSKLIGYNVYEASGMLSQLSTATASTDSAIVLGDFRAGFVIVDRAPMTVAFNPLVLGSSRRPTGEVGWVAFFRTGSDVVNADALRLLVV